MTTSTQCPAPSRTKGGTLRCDQTRAGCYTPSHRRWDPYAPLLDRVWAIKPWWPNLLGWAQDHGRAHVEHITPCRLCTTPKRVTVHRAGWPPTRGSWLDDGTVRRAGRWWVRIGPYVVGDVDSWERSGAA